MNAYRTAPTFDPELSLVAEAQGQIVGHTLFFPNTIMLAGEPVQCAFLAIAGVRPELQRQHGIGGRLVEGGLKLARAKGYKFSIVLGHPTYYPRFGYQTKMWGTCGIKVQQSTLLPAADLETVPVRAKHVPALQEMWQLWHGQTDLTIVPGAGIGDWATYARHIKATVFLKAGEVVGYARYGNALKPSCLLAKTRDDAQAVLAWLSQVGGEGEDIFVPVHPRSPVGQWFTGEALLKPWDAGMAMCLDPGFEAGRDYLTGVAEGTISMGLVLWPALLSSAE